MAEFQDLQIMEKIGQVKTMELIQDRYRFIRIDSDRSMYL